MHFETAMNLVFLLLTKAYVVENAGKDKMLNIENPYKHYLSSEQCVMIIKTGPLIVSFPILYTYVLLFVKC